MTSQKSGADLWAKARSTAGHRSRKSSTNAFVCTLSSAVALEPPTLPEAVEIDARRGIEYWTHALSYVPTDGTCFFLLAMKRHSQPPKSWFSSVKAEDLQRALALIRNDGALSIRDIDDEVLVEKEHTWGQPIRAC
jgi:hypothetical protein